MFNRLRSWIVNQVSRLGEHLEVDEITDEEAEVGE